MDDQGQAAARLWLDGRLVPDTDDDPARCITDFDTNWPDLVPRPLIDYLAALLPPEPPTPWIDGRLAITDIHFVSDVHSAARVDGTARFTGELVAVTATSFMRISVCSIAHSDEIPATITRTTRPLTAVQQLTVTHEWSKHEPGRLDMRCFVELTFDDGATAKLPTTEQGQARVDELLSILAPYDFPIPR
jgi:hypothetical protein